MTDLDRQRFRARWVLVVEAVWPAIWPALGAVGLFLCAALLDLPRLLPGWAHIALLAAMAAAIAILLYRGVRLIRFPDVAAADRRLEAVSGLTHRPLAVLSDSPAHMDAASAALWEAHVARAANMVRNLKAGAPHPGLPRRDPRALRAAVVLGLVACLTVAGRDAPDRIAAALWPLGMRPAPARTPDLRAWITPPSYTRLPPVFLKADHPAVSVPAGSHLTVGVTGTGTAPTLSFGGADLAFRALDAGSFQADRDLTADGRVSVALGGSPMGRWDVTVTPDRPPVVAWASPPGQSRDSEQTRLPWSAQDDYGVTGLRAELRLEARPDAPPLIIPIPLPNGGTKSANGINQQDLTAHPWAGLPVVAGLFGTDFPGQTGNSEPASFVLPERPFTNPIAQTLIHVRKGLSLHPDDRGDEMAALDGLLLKPEALGEDFGALLNLSAIYRKLVADPSPAGIAEAQERLWQLALHLEEGHTETTAHDLEQARREAREALDALMQAPTQANRDALDAKLAELRDAIQRHMEAIQEEARRNGTPPPVPPDGQVLRPEDMQRQTDRTRDAARAGSPREAQERMAELEQMLDRLRDAKAGQQDRKNAEQRQRGRQQMGAVQDMIAREGALLDHAEGRTQQNPRTKTPGSAGDPVMGREADRRVQQALRRALGELMQQFGDLTGEIPPSLGEADGAMRDAARQLSDGRDRSAGEFVQQAIEALQRGAQDMGQAMVRKFGPPQAGEGGESGAGDEALFGMTLPGQKSGVQPGQDPRQAGRQERDPLGRAAGTGSSGEAISDDTTVPEERERQKTLAIQEELRRRGAERARPRPELDYIDRLLKQF